MIVTDQATALTETAEADAQIVATDESAATHKVRREAQNLRNRLRETESERDAMRTRLNAYDRERVISLAEEHGLERGADLLDIGHSVADFLREDGNVDESRLAETVASVLTERPHFGKRQVAILDQGGRESVPVPAPSASWNSMFRRN